MKRKSTEPEFNFADFEDELLTRPTDLWLRHLLIDPRMVADFDHFLCQQIARVQAHAINLRGLTKAEDLTMLQGGSRVLATIRKFVRDSLKQSSEIGSGRDGSRNGAGEGDAGRSERAGQDPGTNRG